MKTFLAVLSVALLAGCQVARPAKQAYTVDSNGAVSVGTRSALDGDTAPGKQELIGVYLPFPPFAIKAGLEWDGTTFNFGGAPATQAVVPSAGCIQQAQACDVQETYVEYQQVTETRTVPVQKTRTVRRATVPIPQAAPGCIQVAPTKAPGCEPCATSSTREVNYDEPPAGRVVELCYGSNCSPR